MEQLHRAIVAHWYEYVHEPIDEEMDVDKFYKSYAEQLDNRIHVMWPSFEDEQFAMMREALRRWTVIVKGGNVEVHIKEAAVEFLQLLMKYPC